MHILITRPFHLGAGLLEKIKAMGDTAELFPVIEIRKTPHQVALQSAISTFDTQDIAIFISQAAVQWGIPAIQTRWPKLPNILWAAIGPGTANALQNLGVPDVLFPPTPPYESESLLVLPAFQTLSLQGKKISLFSGNGGRALLSETLRARGALVQRIEVYQRCLPTLDLQMVEKLNSWHHTSFNAIITTSADSLYNLVKLAEKIMGALTEIPIIVVGERMYQLAKDLNFKSPLVATGADDASIIKVLKILKDNRT